MTLFSGLALLALPALAGAATIVVDDTGTPSGTPSPTGTCEAPNYGTIQAAVDAATAGDTIEVCAGTYVEDPNVDRQLTLAGPNAGISAGWDAGTREPEATIQGELNVSAADTVIDGLEFVRPDVPSNTVPKLIEAVGVSEQITVRNSSFDLRIFGSDPASVGCGSAVWGRAAWTVEDNGFANQFYTGGSSACGSSGNLYNSRVVWLDGAQPSVVRGNDFEKTGQGVYITSSEPAGTVVESNTFNGGLGVLVGSTAGVEIRGNSFLAGNGPYLDSSTNTVIENNLLCGGAGGGPEDPSFPDCVSRTGAMIWTTGTQSGAVASENALLGGYASSVVAPFGGRGIFNYGPNDLDLRDNWWGDLDGSAIAAKRYENPGGLPFAPWIGAYTPDPAKEGEPGFWPTEIEPGATNTFADAATGDDSNDCLSATDEGEGVGPCATINAAIGKATVGGTVTVAAGTYAEQVEISKNDITLNGPNAGRSVGPEAGDPRGPEAIIAPPVDMLAEYNKGVVSIGDTTAPYDDPAENVVVDGFTITGSGGPAADSGLEVNGEDVDAALGVAIATADPAYEEGAGPLGVRIVNNRIENFSANGILDCWDCQTTGYMFIEGNAFDNIATFDVSSSVYMGNDEGQYGKVDNNRFTRVYTGVQLAQRRAPSPEGFPVPSISGNEISAYVAGIWENQALNGSTPFVIDSNQITTAGIQPDNWTITSTDPAAENYYRGGGAWELMEIVRTMGIFTYTTYGTDIALTDNEITDVRFGVRIGNIRDGGSVSLSGGSIEGSTSRAVDIPTQASNYPDVKAPAIFDVTISGVTMDGNAEGVVATRDAADSAAIDLTMTGNAITASDGDSVTLVNGPEVTANRNAFEDGFDNSAGTPVLAEATCNWWGQATGPAEGQTVGEVNSGSGTLRFLQSAGLDSPCLGVPQPTIDPDSFRTVGSLVTLQNADSWEIPEGSGPLTLEYQWEVCEVFLCEPGDWAAIPGATDSTYRLTADEQGDSVRAVITASNPEPGGGPASYAALLPTRNPLGPVQAAPAESSQATPTGQDVEVSFPAIDNGQQVDLAFGCEVTEAGTTTVESRDESQVPEAEGFRFGDPPTAATIETTAVFDCEGEEVVSVCTTYDVDSLPEGVEPRMFHFVDSPAPGEWQDVTVSWDPETGILCGDVDSLSPFAVGRAAATPENTDPPEITGTAKVGETLTASTGTWTGDEPIEYAYQWQRCDSAGETCSDIMGATGETYTAAVADAGSRLRVEVTATNDAGSADAMSPLTGAVTRAPENTDPPEITGTAKVGETLTASTGTWAGDEPIEYAYQWQRSDFATGPWSDLPGATSSTYTVGENDADRYLRVVVEATNDAGAAEAVSDGVEVEPVKRGFGVQVQKIGTGPVRVPRNRTIRLARITCESGGCTVRKAQVRVRVRKRLFNGRALFPTKTLAEGERAVVRIVIPARAARGLSRPGARIASLFLRVDAEDGSRLTRAVRIGLRR